MYMRAGLSPAEKVFSRCCLSSCLANLERYVSDRGVARGAAGGRQGVGRVYFFQIRVARDHFHITMDLTMGNTDCVCLPNSIIIKSNIILTS